MGLGVKSSSLKQADAVEPDLRRKQHCVICRHHCNISYYLIFGKMVQQQTIKTTTN